MYAIVEIAGQQFKVEKGKKIFVHRLEGVSEQELDFDKVLLIENEGKVIIGDPVIKDAFVEAKIIDHQRGDKVIVFKKKRKKGYRIKNGHRQNFTQVEIISIKENGVRRPKKEVVAAEKKELASTEDKPKAAKKPAAKKAAPKAEEKEAPAKKSAAKKTETEKKPAAKKAAKGKE